MRIIIVSGSSGSGKSSALNQLEDMGFYCVDNLPVLSFRVVEYTALGLKLALCELSQIDAALPESHECGLSPLTQGVGHRRLKGWPVGA